MLCELCLSEHDEDALCSNVFWEPLEEDPLTEHHDARPLPELAPPPDMVGQTLGNYRLVRRLGAGGMGTVYLAEQTVIQARVALKVLHPHLSRDESVRARFHAEARTVNLIRHPNLVRIFDICEAPGGLHYLVMEYLEGRSLSQFRRPMEPSFLIPLLAQACEALDAAHRAGVVHRDLKPDNLLVVQREGEAPQLKVLDFGVAKARGMLLDAHQTAVGMVLGTPAYMAPEQWMGKAVDGRADLFSLGVTGYRLLTGQLPFRREQLAERALAGRWVSPVPPHELNPRVPKALSRVLLRTMAWRPEERFATALEFKRALLKVPMAPRALGLSAPDPAPSPPRSTPVSAQTFALRPRRAPPMVPAPAPTTGWVARVRRRNGADTVEVQCTDLSRGGLFMCCEEPFPRLFTRLEFSLLLEGQSVECVGEVVRHVDPAQARVWDMRPGVGVQFVNPSPLLRALLQKATGLHPQP
ncbi:MAG: protein kinase domain-containing protein [Hyalangium sp.]|uniref:protein kinase domain-containing protein n=1 Tax=Hyalangium sp. TaxID=2028555 RepID=UPI00389AB5FF